MAFIPEANRWRKRFRQDVLINTISAWAGTPKGLRRMLLHAYGVKIDKTALVSHSCWFGGTDISVGPGAGIGTGVVLDNTGPITIGSRCMIGMGTKLITSIHEVGPSHHRAQGLKAGPIELGDGCWIGASVIVLPGITIGQGCVIAAGAIVTKDCEPNGLYVGMPARRVRDLPLGPLSSDEADANRPTGLGDLPDPSSPLASRPQA